MAEALYFPPPANWEGGGGFDRVTLHHCRIRLETLTLIVIFFGYVKKYVTFFDTILAK